MFILLVAQTMKDGSQPISAVYKESLDAAYMDMHATMASAYANENVVKCLAKVMNLDGSECDQAYFNRAEEEIVEP